MNSPLIGRRLQRVDGRAKVTGAARYAAEFNQPHQAHAVIVSSAIGFGRVVRVDAEPILRLPGVLAVISHRNAPRLPYRPHKSLVDPEIGERLHVLQTDEVQFLRPAGGCCCGGYARSGGTRGRKLSDRICGERCPSSIRRTRRRCLSLRTSESSPAFFRRTRRAAAPMAP